VTSSPDGIRRTTGSAATLPASTTTLTVTMAPPFPPRTLAAATDSPCARLPSVEAPNAYPTVADGIRAIDTGMAGQRELNAVNLIAGDEPCLVETGPGADGPAVHAALRTMGVGP
jgi:hypothetical protein